MFSISSRNTRLLINLLWSYVSVIGVVYYLKIGVEYRNFSNNILYIIIYILCVCLVAKAMKYLNKKRFLYSAVYSLFTASILIIGAQIEYNTVITWNVATILKIIFLGAFLIPIFILVYYMCTDNGVAKICFDLKYITKWKIYLVVIGIWGIAYLALFPGIYDYDSINQTLQFLVTGEINAHHPVIHSFLLSSFLKIGDAIFGSYEIGLGIYSLLQLLFLAYAAVSVSWYLYEKQKKFLFVISLLFYIFFPLHYIMAVWATKDIIFSALFVLVSLSLLKMLDSESGFWQKKNLIYFVIITALMCMFRNNGIYALILVIPVAFFFYKKYRMRTILLIICSIAIYFSYQNILLPSLNVQPGDMREMMSVPCQQLAKVYVESPEVYTAEEKEILFELIPENNLMDYQYRPMIADATKNYFNSAVFKKDPVKYIRLYISIGIRSPRKYVEAFLTNSLGFWYPNKSYPDERMYHPYVEFNMADPDLFKGDYIYLQRMSLFPQYEAILQKFILNTGWEKFPVISNLFVPGTYFLLLILVGTIILYKQNYRYLLILGLWLGLWITLLISPVALVRYAYPIIICLPLLGYLATINTKTKLEGSYKSKKGKGNGKDSGVNPLL